jgi:predicted ArsR family transcriptional regulator
MESTYLNEVAGIAALDHPVSRAAYELVVDRGWVGREEASVALGVPRSVAAFHLNKLADAGLLETRYERTSGRTGPGAGRPSKLYGRSEREFNLSLPPRRYDVAGAVLAEAVACADSTSIPVKQAVAEVARKTGREVGGESREASRKRDAVMEVLRRQGYEPQKRGREIALLNCPFHALAQQQRDLVCGMNLEFLTGVLEGITGAKLSARLAPEPGFCCVRLAPQ